jgi:hypothetical protein
MREDFGLGASRISRHYRRLFAFQFREFRFQRSRALGFEGRNITIFRAVRVPGRGTNSQMSERAASAARKFLRH